MYNGNSQAHAHIGVQKVHLCVNANEHKHTTNCAHRRIRNHLTMGRFSCCARAEPTKKRRRRARQKKKKNVEWLIQCALHSMQWIPSIKHENATCCFTLKMASWVKHSRRRFARVGWQVHNFAYVSCKNNDSDNSSGSTDTEATTRCNRSLAYTHWRTQYENAFVGQFCFLRQRWPRPCRRWRQWRRNWM